MATRITKTVADVKRLEKIDCCYNCKRWKVDKIRNTNNWCTELNMYTHPTCGCYAYERDDKSKTTD